MIEEHQLYGGKIKLTFDPEKHLYRANGKIVNGVTTILGILNKPLLVSWSSKECAKELGYYERQIWSPEGYSAVPEEEQATGLARLNAILEHLKIMTSDEYWSFLHNAKGAHMRRKSEAANIGTLVHSFIEDYIKGNNPELPTIPKVRNGVDAFLKWVDENKVKFILSEQKVYSLKYKYPGTLDFTAIVNDIPTLGDIKTSNFFNKEMFLQTAAYQHARQEEHPEEKYDQHIIVRCGKDGTLEIFKTNEYKKNIKSFIACCQIYNWQKEEIYQKLK